MNLVEILSILLIHWFADFVLQTDQQAKNKSSSNEWLVKHTFTYYCVWSFFGILYMIYMNNPLLVFRIIIFTI